MPDTPDQTPSRFAPLIRELSATFPKAKFEPTDNPSELASQISRYVPEPERERWYGYLLKDAVPPPAGGVWQRAATNLSQFVLGVAAISVMGGILAGLLLPSLGFRQAMGSPEIARGVITFLFAFGTISIALLIAAASYWVKEPEKLKIRFDYAKDVLMVLIGILGTIIGFYFGKTDGPPPQADGQQIATPAPPANP